MSILLQTIAVGLLTAAALVPRPSSAHIVYAPGCHAAQKLTDGSWLIRSATSFGRAGAVDQGAIIYRRTVINGVDVGAVLERRCVLAFRVEPDFGPFTWPPNGYLTWVTLLQ